jgi:thiamine biosynthesis protein ThiS
VIDSGIAITLNGSEHALPGEMSLADLAASLGIDRRMIAIAHNGEVVRREAHEQVIVRDGDRVEIVRMVGGG